MRINIGEHVILPSGRLAIVQRLTERAASLKYAGVKGRDAEVSFTADNFHSLLSSNQIQVAGHGDQTTTSDAVAPTTQPVMKGQSNEY